MVNTSGAHDLGDFSNLGPEQREKLASMAKDTDTRPAVNAFVVVLTADGGAIAHADAAMLAKYDAKPCTLDQIHAACHHILDDIQASKTAQVTMTFLQQMQMAAAEQAQNQNLLAKVRSGQNGQR